MTTRLYLRDTAPASSPTSGKKSTALPVGTANSRAVTEESLSSSVGSGTFAWTQNSLAQTTHQDGWLGRWSSAALAAQTVAADTWTVALGLNEANTNANAFLALAVYLWRPASSSVVAYVYDSDAAVGAEWPSGGEAGLVATFSGGAVTAQVGDILVVEAWYHAVQGMATAYQVLFGYGGATAVAAGVLVSQPASYVEYAGTLTFDGGGAPAAPASRRMMSGLGL